MSNIYEIIERLCDDKDVTEEEQRLVKEYLENGRSLIKHLREYNETKNGNYWVENGESAS